MTETKIHPPNEDEDLVNEICLRFEKLFGG